MSAPTLTVVIPTKDEKGNIEPAVQRMPDFGNDEYLRMVCVESGNLARNEIELPPGQTSALRVKYITNPL